MQQKLVTLFAILTLGIAPLTAGEYTLEYQGYPYHRTRCALPTFAEGTTVTITSFRPQQAGYWFDGWSYNGHLYTAGEKLTMPAENVVLVPHFYEVGEGIEDVRKNEVQPKKVLLDGQLYLIFDGRMYDVQGKKICDL